METAQSPGEPNPRGALQGFNLETMSGVFPGTRTQIHQRLRLLPGPERTAQGESAGWARAFWYAEPPAMLLYRQVDDAGHLSAEPLLRLENPAEGDLRRRLHDALSALGWTPFTCGSCVHWSPSTSATDDGFQMGRCTITSTAEADVPEALSGQSMLALGCGRWSLPGEGGPEPGMGSLPTAPLPKIAETTESKLKPWPRLKLGIRRRIESLGRPPQPPPTLAEGLSERSGVGAGTEPCFVCQGRIANLGALTTASGNASTASRRRRRSTALPPPRLPSSCASLGASAGVTTRPAAMSATPSATGSMHARPHSSP